MSKSVHIEHVGDSRRQIEWTDLSRDVRYGLYIVQSMKRRDLFRIGAGGVGASEKSTLRERVKAHTTGKASDANPTKQFKLWRLIWTALLPQCNKRATLLAEVTLIAKLAPIYTFVHESIFYAEQGDNAVELIVQTANECEASLSGLINFQTTNWNLLPSDLKEIVASKNPAPGFLT